jgi:UDP-N-acetylmuramyl pentapeptide phosphotransferase/UDP-N-acetylglucosamine-1-phosphate transferase
VLLATLLLGSDGLAAMPLVIVAVVLSFVVTARLTPPPAPDVPTESAEPGTGREAVRAG